MAEKNLPGSKGGRSLISQACVLAFVASALHANAATYTWNGGSSTWGTASNWLPATAYPGASGTTDSVLIDTSSTNQTVSYTLTSSTISNLTINESTASVVNTLQIGAGDSLKVGGALTLNATNGGTVVISNTGTPLTSGAVLALSGNVTLGTVGSAASGTTIINLTSGLGTAGSSWTALSGSTLNIGNGATVMVGDTNSVITTSGETVTVALSSALNISGGSFIVAASTGTGSGSGMLVTAIVNSSLTLSSGTLQLQGIDTGSKSAYSATRLVINGNFTATGGTIIQKGYTGYIQLKGATNTIGAGVTLQANTGDSLSPGPAFSFNTSGAQSLTSAVALYNIYMRGTDTKTIAVTAAGANIGTIEMDLGAGTSGTVKMGSNLTPYSTAALIGNSYSFTSAGANTLDLAGYTYDGSLVSSAWSPVGTSGNAYQWALQSSVAGGAFKAKSFNLTNNSTSTTPYTIGGSGQNIVLQATAGGTTNNLSLYASGGTGAVGTMDASTTFYYTGTGASSSLTGSSAKGLATLGSLKVGDGTNVSTLTLASALQLASGVTVNSNSILDLTGKNLTETGAGVTGGLNGGGTIRNTTSGTATLTLNTTSGDGAFSGGVTDGAGVIALTKNGIGNQVLSGVNNYTGATTIAGGTLTVNGSIAAASTVSVGVGATLAGSGSVSGTVGVSSGTVNGSDSGLTLGATTLHGSSTLSGYNIASSVKVADGTTTLSGTTKSTTSALSVSQNATLNVTNGTVDGSATVSGLLKGNSTVTGTLSLTSGTLASANSSGFTKVGGDFTTDATSTLVAAVSGAVAGTSYDQVQVSGAVSIAGTLDLTTLSGLTLGETIVLIDNTGSNTTTGYFSTIITSATNYTLTSNSDYTFTSGGTEYLLSFKGKAESDSQYNDVTLTVVPEPATWAMLVGGVGMLGFAQRLRRRVRSTVL
ncbi:MAG: beta strand repeat-containing protein [Chthoniobacteraceae bacterium]